MENNWEFLVHIYWFLIFARAENYLNLLKKCWESGNKEAATQTYKKINKKSYESNSDELKCLN